MALRVAVDFGTSSTCVAVSVDGREPQVVVVDGQPLLTSSVYVGTDGTLFVGQEAERQAALDPSRYEPHPKRRIDEAELLLGDTVLSINTVFRAVIGRAVAEARRVAGGAPVDQLVLTHPADWGGIRTQVLRKAAGGLAGRVLTVPEPVAAAVFHAASFPGPPGVHTLAVLDVGGGTVDVSVVRTQSARPPYAPGFAVLATKGNPSFGGADVDQLLMEHIGATVSSSDPDAWRSLVEGRDLPDRRRRRVLRQDVRGAKETLSRHPYTDVPLPSPFPDAHLTRTDLEKLIAVPVGAAVDLVLATVAAAGLVPAQLSGIFLVGGSSRIPLVAQQVAERCGVVPVTLDQPETVVARGALRAVAPEPEHTGVMGARSMADYTAPINDRPGAGPRSRSTGPRPQPTGPRPRPAGPGGVGTGSRLPAVSPVSDPTARVIGQVTSPNSTKQINPYDVPTPNRRKTALLVGAGVLAVAAGVGVTLLLNQDEPDPGRVVAQYEYRFALPEAWKQTGGNPQELSTELKPVGAEQGADRVLVEERRLAFDSGTDRPRALDRLRRDFERNTAFSDFTDPASFAGRDVVYYRERLDERNATVDWYVLLQGKVQVNVGCQYTADGRDGVQRACESVVRSMVVSG
ncbi:type VII secretion-associated protein [Actinokineospora sp. NBRC 105648]|uniref:type VII secretion-associated protein n=1 Tax=Actinokineospora sp. NBRC 105648 TaxID=3032206 RepID=UPI0024A1F294|nr:type VII secretion-associated protein [Actinokineospora sp. NBRC 105648]GLZ42117.1 type VII secretion-associated protein [Actinokineospora sp. NBRC 105648]